MKVGARKDRIDAAGGTAVFVVHDEPDRVRSIMLADVDEVAFPVVIDLEREHYDGWGLIRVPWWRIWLDLQVWRQYVGLMTGGERIRGAGRDTQQLGGDFVVAPGGELVYSRPQHRDDRPLTGELVERLEHAS